MISKLITKYLESNRRLILPTLGAFIKKDDSGEIVFVPYLKSDDGVMKSLISNSLDVSSADAEAMIEEFVFAMKQGVARQGSFVVEGLGVISQDTNGTFTMSYDPTITVVVAEPEPEPEPKPEPVVVSVPDQVVDIQEPINVVVEPMKVDLGSAAAEQAIVEQEQVIVESEPSPMPAPAASSVGNIIDLDVPDPTPIQQEPKVAQTHASQVDVLYSNKPIPRTAEQPKVRVANTSSRNNAIPANNDRRQNRSSKRRLQKSNKQKIDIFMIVAIIAVIAGLLVLLYGMLFPTPDAIFIG